MTSFRAYAAFGLAAAYFGHEFIPRVSTSVIVGELMAEFAVGGAVLGSLSAFYFYAYAGMQIPVGVLIDRFGPRRLMSFAAGISAVGALLYGTASEFVGLRVPIYVGCALCLCMWVYTWRRRKAIAAALEG